MGDSQDREKLRTSCVHIIMQIDIWVDLKCPREVMRFLAPLALGVSDLLRSA